MPLRAVLNRTVPAAVLAAILAAGWFLAPERLPDWGTCIFRRLFDFECPGCGLTRSFLSLARGEWRDSLGYNAAGPLLYAMFALALAESLFPALSLRTWVRAGQWRGGQIAVAIIIVQWGFRVSAYFSSHPFGEYARNLMRDPVAVYWGTWIIGAIF